MDKFCLSHHQRAYRAFPVSDRQRYGTNILAASAMQAAWADAGGDDLEGTVYLDGDAFGWRLFDPDGPWSDRPNQASRTHHFYSRQDLSGWLSAQLKPTPAENVAPPINWDDFDPTELFAPGNVPQTHRNPETLQAKPFTLDDLRRTPEELKASGDYMAPAGGPHDFHSCRYLDTPLDFDDFRGWTTGSRTIELTSPVKLEGPAAEAFIEQLRALPVPRPDVSWLPLQRHLWALRVVEQMATQRPYPWPEGEARRHIDASLDWLAVTLDGIVGAVNGWECEGDR